MSIQWNKELYHYGIPRRSGRYKWGSGNDPYHHGLDGPKKIKDRYKREHAKAYVKGDKAGMDAAKYKAYESLKKYKMAGYEGRAQAKGEKTEARMLAKGATPNLAKKAGEAKAEAYRKSKAYTYDFNKMASVPTGKYVAGKVILRDKEAERLINSAGESNKANKTYMNARKAANESAKKSAAEAKAKREGYKAKKKDAKAAIKEDLRKKNAPHKKVIDDEWDAYYKRNETSDMVGNLLTGGRYENSTAQAIARERNRAIRDNNTADAEAAVRKNKREAKKKTLQSNLRYDKKIYGENSRKVRRGKKKLAKYR